MNIHKYGFEVVARSPQTEGQTITEANFAKIVSPHIEKHLSRYMTKHSFVVSKLMLSLVFVKTKPCCGLTLKFNVAYDVIPGGCPRLFVRSNIEGFSAIEDKIVGGSSWTLAENVVEPKDSVVIAMATRMLSEIYREMKAQLSAHFAVDYPPIDKYRLFVNRILNA